MAEMGRLQKHWIPRRSPTVSISMVIDYCWQHLAYLHKCSRDSILLMKLTIKSSLSKCFGRFDKAREVPKKGHSWVKSTAIEFESGLHANLAAQQANLSGATRRMYAIHGRPDGSGIRDHISHSTSQSSESLRITVGISSGKPTMIAKVQEYGITIKVTEKMRSWFQFRGINLKSSTIFIRIPGRRFWSKSFRIAQKNSKNLLQKL